MSSTPVLQGELQLHIMNALWRLERGSVEQVRAALPSRYRSAYNTVQTVLNRLTERGLLSRTKSGNVYLYEPKLSEGDYYSRTIESTLATASNEARDLALANLIGGLDRKRLGELRRLAQRAQSKRETRG